MIKNVNAKISLRQTLRIVGALFVLTGCAGLLAEQCFEKLLIGLTGASTPAAAIVLSVYFLGLTLGALFYGRYRRNGWNALKIYGCLEAGIGIWTIFLLLSYQLMIVLFIPLLMRGADEFWVLQSLRFLVACTWILPPTVLMGATFPVIVDVLEGMRIPKPRKATARFYALNLAGAVLGALLGPYWSFPSWGLHGTMIFTAVIDIMVAAEVFLLVGRIRLRGVQQTGLDSEKGSKTDVIRRHIVLVTISFYSGFLFFGLEVLWTHLIGAALGNSVYAFAAMLALVLMGLGIGGLLSVVLFREERPLSPIVTSVLLFVVSAALGWQYYAWPRASVQFITWGGDVSGFWEGEMLRWFQAARLLLPVAVTLGMVYPSLFRMSVFPLHNRGQVAAVVTGFNSAGCVLGALVCGFILIPWIGSEMTLLTFGIVSVISGCLVALIYSRGVWRMGIGVLSVALLFGWMMPGNWDRLSLTSGGHVYFQRGHVNQFSILEYFHEDTLGGITTVVSNPLSGAEREGKDIRSAVKTLLTNGKFQATDGLEVDAQTGFALLPAFHVRRYEDALVIGLGSGHSAGVVKALGFKRVDIAEIAPGIVGAARNHFAHINGGIVDGPGVRLFLEDGRNHLLLHLKKYDMITMEISSIWFSGAGSLYSREFYQLCKNRLSEGGIMQQWIQIHHLGIDELGSVIATMREVFPYVSFWVFGGQGILLGSGQPQELKGDAIRAFFRANPWRDPDNLTMKRRFTEILRARLLAPGDTDKMVSTIHFTVNTDANRFLEYATPRYNLSRLPHAAINLKALWPFATFPGHQFESVGLDDFTEPGLTEKQERKADR